jgi:hypothetical protein
LSFIANMRQGRHGLGVTFWLWFLLPQVALRACLLVASPGLAISDDGARLLLALDFGVAVISLIWFCITGPGVWRAARRKGGVWGAVACWIVILNICYLMFYALASGITLMHAWLNQLWVVRR